jgi:hypothetical protein
MHMFLRETGKRRQYERQRRMKASTSQLAAEQQRSSTLLLNMLPASIVKQLTVRTQHNDAFSLTLPLPIPPPSLTRVEGLTGYFPAVSGVG